jgi:hypothetical protein
MPQKVPAADPEVTRKLNSFMRRLMEAVNSGSEYDLRRPADLSGIELATAKEIEEQIRKKVK